MFVAAFARTLCVVTQRSSGMMLYFPDIFSQQQTMDRLEMTFQTATSQHFKLSGKLFECVSEPLRDNAGVERQRFTHVWYII